MEIEDCFKSNISFQDELYLGKKDEENSFSNYADLISD